MHPRAQSVLKCLAIATLTVAASCGHDGPRLTGSRRVSFGIAQLVTQFHKDQSTNRELALLHVLFVPDTEPRKGSGFGLHGGASGTNEHMTIDYAYDEFDWSSRRLSIRSQEVHVLQGKLVEAGGHTFDLERGNMFVAHVSLDGALQVKQLLDPQQRQDTGAESVLSAMKSQLPADVRLQALKTSR